VSDRAVGYGMPGYTVNGKDPLEVYKVVKEAADRARKGEGPTLIEAVTYRLTPHSSDDDDSSYRSPDEVAEAKTKDPIILFGAYLKEVGVMNDQLEKEINNEVMALVNEATEYAEQAPYAKPEDALKYVYKES
jgi:2-oxoisovalerate dehydrogenase E1 component alpha subunit